MIGDVLQLLFRYGDILLWWTRWPCIWLQYVFVLISHDMKSEKTPLFFDDVAYQLGLCVMTWTVLPKKQLAQ